MINSSAAPSSSFQRQPWNSRRVLSSSAPLAPLRVGYLHKACDVKKGILIATETTTAQILIDASAEAASPYRNTPLDFVAKESMTFGCGVMDLFGLRSDSTKRPLRQFPNDQFPDISSICGQEASANRQWRASRACYPAGGLSNDSYPGASDPFKGMEVRWGRVGFRMVQFPHGSMLPLPVQETHPYPGC